MDEDATADAADSDTIQWRRDASTSRTVRLCWALGVGTFFAAISIVVFWRFYDIATQSGAGPVVLALFAAVLVTALALATDVTRLAAFARRLPISELSDRGLERARLAVFGTIAMIVVIGALMLAGRYVSRRELLEVGAGPFTGLAALFIPLALVALVLASFLRSVGALNRTERELHLYDPDQTIDLALIEGTSTRQLGDAVIVKLEYAQPDGQYVAGPRRIVVPPAVADELQTLVDRQPATQ